MSAVVVCVVHITVMSTSFLYPKLLPFYTVLSQRLNLLHFVVLIMGVGILSGYQTGNL